MTSSLLYVYQNSKYNLYLLVIVILTYVLNQVDRYLLPVVTTSMGRDLEYGDKTCVPNTSYNADTNLVLACMLNGTNESSCLAQENAACSWNYNGLGLDYAVLVGPAFIFIYTIMGLCVGYAGEVFNRKNLLGICLIAWSLVTIGIGFAQNYWQLVMLRLGLGFWEAGCTPFVTTLLIDSFPIEMRTAAVAIYNWGLHIGYSLAYALGDFLPQTNILDMGWRWVFYFAGISGVILGIIIFLTLKDPRHFSPFLEDNKPKSPSWNFSQLARTFLMPSIFLLCLAGSLRNAAIYIWVFYTQPYFEMVTHNPQEIGMYMSWIPAVGGIGGAIASNILIERYLHHKGPFLKILILSCSQITATLFALGSLYLQPPYAYISQLLACFLGDIWINLSVAAVVDISPASVRWASISFYFFIITNVGGNAPLLVPLIEKAFKATGYNHLLSLKYTLYILYPGLFLLSSLLFLSSIAFLWHDMNRVKEIDYKPMPFIRPPVIIISSEDTSSNASSERVDQEDEITADIQ